MPRSAEIFLTRKCPTCGCAIVLLLEGMQNWSRTIIRLPKQKVHSDVVGSRNVSREKVFDLRDVYGLFDGGASAADLKETALQRVLTDHHSEKHSHLIIPKMTQRHTSETRPRSLRLLPLQHWIALYFAFSCSIDVGSVSRYPGHAEILASINSCSSPSHTYKIIKYSLIYFD